MIVENYVIYFMMKVYSTICTSVNILLRVSLVLEACLRLGTFHPFPPECAGNFGSCGIVGLCRHHTTGWTERALSGPAHLRQLPVSPRVIKSPSSSTTEVNL